MKNMKIAFWGIVLVFAAVFVYQNKTFFMSKQILSLKLPFFKVAHTPELPLVILFLVFFLAGFLIAYFFSLYERFLSNRTIRNLNAAATSQLEELAALKMELEALRRGVAGAAAATQAPETTGMETPA